MERKFKFTKLSLMLLFTSIYVVGCSENDYMDPTQIGRFRPVPAVNVILDSLGVAEEPPPSFAGAEEPKPVDAMVLDKDYVLYSGDVVRVTIFELQNEGVPYVNDFQVSETGKVSIPYAGQVTAAGLTEAQLEDEIRQILSPAYLKDPLVTVILQNSAGRVFTILGEGVPNPGRFGIPRYDFRLADALAIAGSPAQFNVSYIYVTRTITGKEPQEAAEAPVTEQPSEELPLAPEDEMLDIIAPTQASKSNKLIAASEMGGGGKISAASSENQDIEDELSKMLENAAADTAAKPGDIQEIQTGPVEWIFQDGKWVPVRTGIGAHPQIPAQLPQPIEPKAQESQKAQEAVPAGYGIEQIGTAGVQKRVIKISVKAFLGGDPRYNIVIKPGDLISVPVDVIGEFYVLGNTNNQGIINLTGRPMTLMQATAASGGLGALAWPERVEVRRRISDNKEEIVLVNLKKIASGSQPDFFIKPNDLVNIGTHPGARWLAVLRNAFRATYGFGFIYDRNFADRDFGNDPLPF